MSDETFVASSQHTVHHGDRDDGAKCGTQVEEEWATVDASNEEEAVMKYDLVPCTRCMERSYELEQWRKDVHSSLVMHNVEAPKRWQR